MSCLLFGLLLGFPVLSPLIPTTPGAWRVYGTGYPQRYVHAWEVSVVYEHADLLNHIRRGEHALSERIRVLCDNNERVSEFPRKDKGVVDDEMNR